MNIHIVVVAYVLDDELDALLDHRPAVGKKNKFHWHLFLHSKVKAVVSVCEAAAKRKNVTYYPYGENRGLAKSWNEGILNGYLIGADVVVVINDDMVVGEGDIEAVAAEAIKQRGDDNLTAIVHGTMLDDMGAWVDSGYGFFVVQPLAIETIGMFDEQFMPIYYEDMDYDYRLDISGFDKVVVETTLAHSGSATINASSALHKQNDVTLEANKAYYVAKWGGEPGRERFTQPFNDLRFSTRIAPCDCPRPYWGFERDDLEGIVKI